jgi:predicted lipase
MKNLSKICCQACINTYKGEHGRVKAVLSDVNYFEKKHVEGHIGKYNRKTILVFRGSDGNADWVDNFKFWKVKAPKSWFGEKCKVHKGWLEQWETIRHRVHYLTEGLDQIIITGHSLGGALATFAAIELSKKMHVTLVTFGSPRVGSLKFVRLFNKAIAFSYRFVNGADTVCKVPMSWIGYGHVAKKIKLGNASIIEKILHPIRKVFGNPMDHKPQRYLKEL